MGTKNAAFGKGSLGLNKSGSSNSAFGFEALQLNTIGKSNVAIGVHGLLNKEENDRKLFISVKPEKGVLKYIIQDNGVGRLKAEEYKMVNRPSHHSMGMQITTQRIHLFNQEGNGSVKIIDLYNDQDQPSGTKVEICLNDES